MVEKWLDDKVLQLLQQPANPDDDVSEIPHNKAMLESEIPTENKVYDPVKLDVVLPSTNEIEQIEYIPPEIGAESSISASSIGPCFKEMKPYFKPFELIKPMCIPAIPDK